MRLSVKILGLIVSLIFRIIILITIRYLIMEYDEEIVEAEGSVLQTLPLLTKRASYSSNDYHLKTHRYAPPQSNPYKQYYFQVFHHLASIFYSARVLLRFLPLVSVGSYFDLYGRNTCWDNLYIFLIG